MADTDLQDVPLQVRRVPDFSVETDEAGHKFKVELPGMFEVGFSLGGVFRPVYTFKAAGLLADIERAKKAAAAEGVTTDQPAPSAPADASTTTQ